MACWSPSKPAYPIFILYISPFEVYLLLALPPEAESLVDPELSGNGEEGHADGDAADVY
ncbi:hypothetical protein A1F99_068050 [Pyrenophora tritici-repentis]|nr:hypothetical protein A1F99_068050 [Pyrenophora tritici-repentis]